MSRPDSDADSDPDQAAELLVQRFPRGRPICARRGTSITRAPDEPTRACYKRPVPVIHDVAIVGGGVAGAATAVGFATKGSSVVLFERRDLARDPNRGDVIHPDARAILDRWGALDALRERGGFDARRLTLADASGLLKARFRTFRRPALMLNHAEIELGLLGVASAYGAEIRDEPVRAVHREGEV